MPSAPLMLNYHARRPNPWRRYLLVAVLLIIVIGYCARYWWPVLSAKLTLLEAQRACTTFSAEPGNKVMEDQVAVRFSHLFSKQVPTEYDLSGDDGNFVFVGRLFNKQGARLVLIRKVGWGEMNRDTFIWGAEAFEAYVLEPATLLRDPKLLTGNDVEPSYEPTPGDHSRSMIPAAPKWIGVSDTKDRSRFSIPFEAQGKSGFFRGWLDDADHIHLIDTSEKSIWNQYAIDMNSRNTQ